MHWQRADTLAARRGKEATGEMSKGLRQVKEFQALDIATVPQWVSNGGTTNVFEKKNRKKKKSHQNKNIFKAVSSFNGQDKKLTVWDNS